MNKIVKYDLIITSMSHSVDQQWLAGPPGDPLSGYLEREAFGANDQGILSQQH